MAPKQSMAMALGMFCLLGFAAASAADAPSTKDCDKILDGGRCLKMVDGKIFIDGKEAKAFSHTESTDDSSQVQLPVPPAGVERIAAVYDRNRLVEMLHKGRDGFALPQMYLVDLQTGRLASADDLPAPLADFFKNQKNPPSAAFDAHATDLLTSILGSVEHSDGSALRKEDFAGKRFAAFQLWAGWCVPCMQEAKRLGEILSKVPAQQFAWVAVETDPSKAMGGPNGAKSFEIRTP